MKLGMKEHDHCWHVYGGSLLMVIPDGHIVQKCCNCPDTRVVHRDHSHTNTGGSLPWIGKKQ